MAAVLVLGATSGCSTFDAQPRALKTPDADSFSSQAFAQDQEDLEAYLVGLSDVHSVVSIEAEAVEHREVRITIEPAWIAENAIPPEVIAAESICNRPSMQKRRCILDLVGVGGSRLVLDVSRLSVTELESEIAYARSLAGIAGGTVILKVEPIYERASGEPSHSRFVGVNGCELYQGESIWEGPCNQVIDWDALEAIPAPMAVPTTWEVGRLVAHGSFATEEVTALLEQSNALVVDGNLGKFSFADHASIEWFGSTATFGQTVWSSDYLGSSQFSETRAWSKVLEVLEWTMQAPGSSSFGFYASYNTVYEGGTIHFGTCTTPIAPTPGDQALYDAVLAAGVTLPSGSGAGACEAP